MAHHAEVHPSRKMDVPSAYGRDADCADDDDLRHRLSPPKERRLPLAAVPPFAAQVVSKRALDREKKKGSGFTKPIRSSVRFRKTIEVVLQRFQVHIVRLSAASFSPESRLSGSASASGPCAPSRSWRLRFGLLLKKRLYDGIPVALSLYAFRDRVHVALIQHSGIALLKLDQTSLSLSFIAERFRVELLEIALFHDNPYVFP